MEISPAREVKVTLKTQQLQQSPEGLEMNRAGPPAEGCGLSCQCEKCADLGYTEKLVLQNDESPLFGGPLMVRLPVSQFYQMAGTAVLNYRIFHQFELRQVTKLKCHHVMELPGLKKIYLSLKPNDLRKEFTVNCSDLPHWFIGCVRAKLYVNNKFGIPTRPYAGTLIGTVCVRSWGRWVRRGAEVTDRLRLEGGEEVKAVREFWTRFQIIDRQGLHLVVKFWDFLSKWQLALPLKDLSLWLWALLSLVRD